MKPPGSVAHVGRVAFELSRFEVVGELCHVEGQWFGVRGRRFMRPALTVVVDGQSIPLLADLADKPWAVQDGEPWKATFPYTIEHGKPPAAELTVAPDLTVTLPAPELPARAPRKKSVSGRGDASQRLDRTPAGSGSRIGAEAALELPDRRRHGAGSPALAGERDGADQALNRELADLQDSQRRLQQRLERVQDDKATTAQRLDRASRELRDVVRERDESNAARDRIAAELEAVERERHRLTVDREAAQRAHDEALQASEAAGTARDRALSERAAAIAARDGAASERDVANAARDRAVAECHSALSVRDHALAERDAAVAARDEAISGRDALARTSEQLQAELADRLSSHGAALVMRRSAQTPVASRRHDRLFPAAIPIAIALALVLILLVVLHVL